MSRYPLLQSALLTFALAMSSGAGAAPSDSEGKQNTQRKQAPTPSACNQIRQKQQELLEKHSEKEGRIDSRQALENMEETTRERFKSLKARLQRCQ